MEKYLKHTWPESREIQDLGFGVKGLLCCLTDWEGLLEAETAVVGDTSEDLEGLSIKHRDQHHPLASLS